MDAAQVEAIERATVQAVSPDAQAEIPGWIRRLHAGLDLFLLAQADRLRQSPRRRMFHLASSSISAGSAWAYAPTRLTWIWQSCCSRTIITA